MRRMGQMGVMGMMLLALCLARGQNLLPAFLGAPAGIPFPYDNAESYTDGAALNALNGGTLWGGAYADATSAFGVQASDDIESYSDGANLDTLNAGSGTWGGAYSDALGYTGVQASDTIESYSDTAAVNGLNAGSGFGGAFADRP